jgi:RNA polymerase sigma-70 factor (ECF subfamily)
LVIKSRSKIQEQSEHTPESVQQDAVQLEKIRTDRTLSSKIGDAVLHSVEISEESALVEQARQDPAAFGILYERYIDRVYAYIYHRVGNGQDAEDLTARTFYRALGKLDTYEDRGLPFSAWLFRIAHNLVANWHRDHSRRRFLSLDRLWSYGSNSRSPEALIERPEDLVEQEEKHEALWAAINRLPEDRRDLLIHKFSSRLSNVEIGDMMNKSESAVKSLYFRTLSSLRDDLEARGWGKQAPEDQGPDRDAVLDERQGSE